jgi:hypothetical protein
MSHVVLREVKTFFCEAKLFRSHSGHLENFMEPKRSLPCSQESSIGPCLGPCESIELIIPFLQDPF